MANVKLIFNGDGDTSEHELQCFLNTHNEIFLDIDMCNGFPASFITLDKSTAIKLAKTLRTEINKIKE